MSCFDPVHAAPGTCLMLVRHGETQWNLDQRIQGHYDVELTAKGHEQARRLADRLACEPPDLILTSDLLRARATAEAVSRGVVPIEIEPRLREASFGEWEGKTTPEIRAAFPDAFHAWRHDPLNHRPPGGETIQDLGERCLAALRDHLPRHPGKRVLVVAHGGPVRVMAVGVLQLPLTTYPKLRVENTSLARFLFTDRGAILAAWNDTGHLLSPVAAPSHTGWEEK